MSQGRRSGKPVDRAPVAQQLGRSVLLEDGRLDERGAADVWFLAAPDGSLIKGDVG